MPIIDYKDSVVQTNDIAARDVVGGRTASRTVKLMMFCSPDNASWAAETGLKEQSYPVAELSFPANRSVFRLEPGDSFVLNYAPYAISGMVCRVVKIQEESLESERITVSAREDVNYIARSVFGPGPVGLAEKPDQTLSLAPLTCVKVAEAPYVLAGAKVAITTMAGRVSGTETGYEIYMSVDGGSSYGKIGYQTTFNPCGTLVSDWPPASYSHGRYPYQVGLAADVKPEEVGFQVDIAVDATLIETITRDLLFTGRNMSLLGDELISFQTITPVGGFSDRYEMTGVYRGRIDTLRQTHLAGTRFMFVGSGFFNYLENPEITVGATRHFKFVPYNAKAIGDISEATAIPITIGGRAKKPYLPWNFMANQGAFRPVYTCASTTTTSSSTTSTTE